MVVDKVILSSNPSLTNHEERQSDLVQSIDIILYKCYTLVDWRDCSLNVSYREQTKTKIVAKRVTEQLEKKGKIWNEVCIEFLRHDRNYMNLNFDLSQRKRVKHGGR